MKVIRKPVHSPSALYLAPISNMDMDSRLNTCIEQALARMSSQQPMQIFFRADDVAIPDSEILKLMRLFQKYGVPLALAVIPAWLTPVRWKIFQKIDRQSPELWQWHTHGWRHVNHESSGKKQEFGPSRPHDALMVDL
ncbi:MAG TPA: hypothetical protein VLP30_05240, partial [Desulfatirhabdiaceae bacterium]|nr:hypothetical protein [Desulfatirhabdiaceae bacterium]